MMRFGLLYLQDLPVEYILVLVLLLHVISKQPHHVASSYHLPRHLNDSFMGFLLLQLRACVDPIYLDLNVQDLVWS